MKRGWYFIRDATERTWALYDEDKFPSNDRLNFDPHLVGYISREHDGSWSCFYNGRYMGNEPNREYAMELVGSDYKKRGGNEGQAKIRGV